MADNSLWKYLLFDCFCLGIDMHQKEVSRERT